MDLETGLNVATITKKQEVKVVCKHCKDIFIKTKCRKCGEILVDVCIDCHMELKHNIITHGSRSSVNFFGKSNRRSHGTRGNEIAKIFFIKQQKGGKIWPRPN